MRTVPFLTVLLALATGSAAIAARATRPPVPTSAATVFIGSVTDVAGAALPGAQVQISGTTLGAIADAAGAYRFDVPAGAIARDVWVEASLIGYEKQARRVHVEGDTVRIDFALAAARIELDEVVATDVPALQYENRREEAAKALERQALAPHPINAARAAMSMAVAPAPGGRVARVPYDPGFNTEEYDPIAENPFLTADANPLSTFSIDVDRASYGNVRRFIDEGRLPPRDAVRIEELLNYFTYDDALPTGEHPFAVTTQLGPAPWTPRHQLLRIGLRSRAIETAALPPGNLVFLIDVSGSMQSPDKLPLLKQAFGLLVDQLRPQDQVAIVVYAGAAGLVLPATSGDRKDEIMAAIDQLEAGGSTAGGAGLRLAYDVALQHFIRGGNNRVILATDGDFNIGESSDAAMVRLIEEKRRQGTFLTVLGFGTGNLKDAKMEKLADHGNGNYAYIDDLMEARKVLVNEIGGTLVTVAKDVKLQVEFNPARVRAYRLIGYENRLLAAEDFDDDAKDAGEMGAGHSVTALYEIVPVGVETDAKIRGVDSLRYRRPAQRTRRAASDELAYVKIRYKLPDADTSIRFDQPVADRITAESADFTFSAAVAAFGLVLRDSEHRGSATFDQVIALASHAIGEDRGGYRSQFIELVKKARTLKNPVASDQEEHDLR